MKVFINGDERSLAEEATLKSLQATLAGEDPFFIEAKGVAIAVNDSVISKSEWPRKQLQEGDKVLIIKATQGG